ncbi:flagellar basal-body rod protein FlgF [Thioalkalivibrio sulfidiphilus]|uniref:Flagellar basal-body rod protein FlgF n=1 Tax=Thioalkalivibrio sulfidiphilus (strain HL-EbGR7) TaxID=396588 RepID=B8GQB2_THISH|nr:flagellar basal-body rod protein FlgF [Thioalkalivibrio sulfidiphilus]ACL72307.1 flagellar basal-body rod protein FlgF [Thioalkalivibrio sulfidiphilus HL-EbGr7]
MDRMLYVAMSGAKETALTQARNTQNLANANTTGFKASLDVFTSKQVVGPGHGTRTYALTQDMKVDLSPGPLQATGRDLDVAVQGNGWIAVQAPDGTEAYTRAGDLRVDSVGLLTTGTGLPVLGEGGPIAVPPFETFEIGSDGTISIRPLGQGANVLAEVDRIKLVNPNPDELVRGEDGLIRHQLGVEQPPDAGVTLVRGMLESSNVNTVEAMVNMIDLARHFEMQVKMMKTAEDNDAASASLLRLT